MISVLTLFIVIAASQTGNKNASTGAAFASFYISKYKQPITIGWDSVGFPNGTTKVVYSNVNVA